jgi:hypothetical protein
MIWLRFDREKISDNAILPALYFESSTQENNQKRGSESALMIRDLDFGGSSRGQVFRIMLTSGSKLTLCF